MHHYDACHMLIIPSLASHRAPTKCYQYMYPYFKMEHLRLATSLLEKATWKRKKRKFSFDYFPSFLWLLRLRSSHCCYRLSFPKVIGCTSEPISATNIHLVVSLANTSYQRWVADSHRWQPKISAASFDLELWKYSSKLRWVFQTFYNIYFSRLSYFVSNRSDEKLRKDLGRDKRRTSMALSNDRRIL